MARDSSKIDVKALTPAQGKAEHARLEAELKKHDEAYHQRDAPTVSDAEYDALRRHKLPDHLALLPGCVETTSNIVEHPEVIARRIQEAVSAVGDRERVIASADCGFGTFTRREWVIEPVVWLKLKALREGADLASARLW